MIEEKIAAHIRNLLSATANADSEGILSATLALDTLQKERASEIKGHLNHYLGNRSYQKALAFIEGQPE
jgi:hypothetical protein